MSTSPSVTVVTPSTPGGLRLDAGRRLELRQTNLACKRTRPSMGGGDTLDLQSF